MSFKPVDLRFGQNIIQNYLATIESQQRQQQLEQEKVKQEQQHEIELKQLEQTHTYQQGLLDQAQKQLELSQLVDTHTLAQKHLQQATELGIAPPGGSIEKPQLSTPEAGSGMQPISQTLGLGTEQQRVSFDPRFGISPVVTLEPIAAAKLKGRAALEEALPKLTEEERKQTAIGGRELLLEAAKAEAANQIKRMEMDRSGQNAQLAAQARMYAADRSYQGRIRAAEIQGGKLTGTQKTAFDSLSDIIGSIDAVQKSLGDISDPKSGWQKWFTNSSIDEAARNHPNLDVFGTKKDVEDIAGAINAFENTLGEKGKSNVIVQQSLLRGLAGARNQSPLQAKNNLDALRHQLELQKINIGGEQGKVNILQGSIVKTPDGPITFPSPKEAKQFIEKHPELKDMN